MRATNLRRIIPNNDSSDAPPEASLQSSQSPETKDAVNGWECARSSELIAHLIQQNGCLSNGRWSSLTIQLLPLAWKNANLLRTCVPPTRNSPPARAPKLLLAEGLWGLVTGQDRATHPEFVVSRLPRWHLLRLAGLMTTLPIAPERAPVRPSFPTLGLVCASCVPSQGLGSVFSTLPTDCQQLSTPSEKS